MVASAGVVRPMLSSASSFGNSLGTWCSRPQMAPVPYATHPTPDLFSAPPSRATTPGTPERPLPYWLHRAYSHGSMASRASLNSAGSVGSLSLSSSKNSLLPGGPWLKAEHIKQEKERLRRLAKREELMERQRQRTEMNKYLKERRLEKARLRAEEFAALTGSQGGMDTESRDGDGYQAAEPAKKAPDKKKLKASTFVQSASDALNSRFSDMFKAFQYVDLDRSGTLDKKELVRALDLWNIPLDEDKLDDLIAACDDNGDGQVDYKEFVDVLARDTVACAAMGKRDMQASEAMGVVDLDPEFLGHKKIKNVRASINDAYM